MKKMRFCHGELCCSAEHHCTSSTEVGFSLALRHRARVRAAGRPSWTFAAGLSLKPAAREAATVAGGQVWGGRHESLIEASFVNATGDLVFNRLQFGEAAFEEPFSECARKSGR